MPWKGTSTGRHGSRDFWWGRRQRLKCPSGARSVVSRVPRTLSGAAMRTPLRGFRSVSRSRRRDRPAEPSTTAERARSVNGVATRRRELPGPRANPRGAGLFRLRYLYGQAPGRVLADGNRLVLSAPEGRPHRSPGQRPGEGSNRELCPGRARQQDDTDPAISGGAADSG